MEELIKEGQNLISIANNSELKDRYDLWCHRVKTLLRSEGFPQEEQREFVVMSHYTNNEFSPEECQKSILNALKNTIAFLERIKQFRKTIISEEIGLTIIERVLKNFYMYFQAMYRAPVHKGGKLVQEVLDKIQIGNEYDLQRMLYSILLPIFPTIRQEVNSDNGYGGMRGDIYLEDYSLIIETKYTHNGMCEKRLLEELGADGFHYRAKTVFILIFDKNNIIKNSQAFERAFKRDKEKDGKTVRVFIIQVVGW